MEEIRSADNWKDIVRNMKADIECGNFEPHYMCTIPVIKKMYCKGFSLEAITTKGPKENKWLIIVNLIDPEAKTFAESFVLKYVHK